MDFRDSPCLSEAIESCGWQPVTDRIVNSLSTLICSLPDAS